MKDSKTLLLLCVSILLLLASMALLWSWGYQFSLSHKENIEKPAAAALNKTAIKTDLQISDSLQKAYYATLDHLDKSIDSVFYHSDSLNVNLEARLAEFYQIRNQITLLFNNRLSNADIKLANSRIDQLQQRIEKLQSSNFDVESENKRLNNLLLQYQNQQQQPTISTPTLPVTNNANSFEQNKVVTAPKPVASKINSTNANPFSTSNLQLNALSDNLKNADANNTIKITGSFVLKNNSSPNNSAEIIVVVMQPDGKVIQKSTWESGLFQTNSGKKIYSCKLQTDCKNGEAKKIDFWLTSDKSQKGMYSMLLYQNGNMIGKVSKQLI